MTENLIVQRAREEKRNFILNRYERQRNINRVILNSDYVPGNALADWSDGCNNHGVCQEYTCYWYDGYTGDDCQKEVDDYEDGVKYYIVLLIWGIVLIVAFLTNCIANGFGEDVKIPKIN